MYEDLDQHVVVPVLGIGGSLSLSKFCMVGHVWKSWSARGGSHAWHGWLGYPLQILYGGYQWDKSPNNTMLMLSMIEMCENLDHHIVVAWHRQLPLSLQVPYGDYQWDKAP